MQVGMRTTAQTFQFFIDWVASLDFVFVCIDGSLVTSKSEEDHANYYDAWRHMV